MKKVKMLFVMVLAVLALSISSCKKAKAKNCNEAVTEYFNASDAYYNSEFTVADCETLKSALKSFIDDCLSKFPEASRAEIQDWYDEIDSMGCEAYVAEEEVTRQAK